jgi:hypothetical protein
MKLYHGSNVFIEQVDLSLCKPYKDFGRGFYLTSLPNQALAMAQRTTRIAGAGNPTVTMFELDDDWQQKGLKTIAFSATSREWATFVINNRNREFADKASPKCNHLNQYDIVYGPVADDSIVASFQLFRDGRITIDELVEQLRYKKLNDQYSFHTADALALLTNKGEMK